MRDVRSVISEGDRVFAADSMLWRICREHVILLHGPAAAVMQIAQPRIGLGVFQHSDFQSAPTARLDRTLDTVYTIGFGTIAEANAAARRVHGIHQRVGGDAQAHDVPGEPKYSAFELDLLMWVIATMIMSSIQGYERAVAKLSDAEKEEFYGDMRVLGTFFELPSAYGPQDWESFQKYWAQQIADERLGSHAISRKVAWAVARPHRPWWLWAASWPMMFMFTEIIPEPVRGRLGFRSNWWTRMSLAVATMGLRAFVRIAPGRVRFVPHYRKARKSAAMAMLTVSSQKCMGQTPLLR